MGAFQNGHGEGEEHSWHGNNYVHHLLQKQNDSNPNVPVAAVKPNVQTPIVEIGNQNNNVGVDNSTLASLYNKQRNSVEGLTANNQTNNKMTTVVRHEFSFASSYLDDFSRSLIKDPTIAFKFRDTFIEDKRGYLS